jgi:hypothetical protein
MITSSSAFNHSPYSRPKSKTLPKAGARTLFILSLWHYSLLWLVHAVRINAAEQETSVFRVAGYCADRDIKSSGSLEVPSHPESSFDTRWALML